MKPFEPRTQALLRATRNADEPTDEQVQRVNHMLMAKIAAGGAAAAGLQTLSSSATGATSSALVAKLALLPMTVKVSISVAVLGLGALGGYKLVSPAPVARPAVESLATQRPDPTPAATTPEIAPTSKPESLPDQNPAAEAHEPSAAAPRFAPRPSHQPPVSGHALQEEAQLLAEVQSALGAGQGSKALDKLNEYDQRFAGGVLRAEADAARVFALCQSGRRADAQAAARRFLHRYPSSPSASRVQQACADQPVSPKPAR